MLGLNFLETVVMYQFEEVRKGVQIIQVGLYLLIVRKWFVAFRNDL